MMFSVIFLTQCNTSAQSPGIFDNNSDVGSATHAGSARFIQSSKEYQLIGGGANIWGEKDAFQYLWKKDSGDFSLTTRIRWIGDGKVFQPVGSVSVALVDPVYVGLAVCSHDDTTTETAIFSKVKMKSLGTHKMEDRIIESSLETISSETGRRHIVYRSGTHFEAPNFSNDGKYLLFNSDGRLYTIPISGGKPVQLNTSFADRCNNDHGFSPDGKMLAISHHLEGKSLIYTLPSSGGTPRLVTELEPSYWHGWSPDGKTLTYSDIRHNLEKHNIAWANWDYKGGFGIVRQEDRPDEEMIRALIPK